MEAGSGTEVTPRRFAPVSAAAIWNVLPSGNTDGVSNAAGTSTNMMTKCPTAVATARTGSPAPQAMPSAAVSHTDAAVVKPRTTSRRMKVAACDGWPEVT
jgi:hypothetical protein